MKIIYEKFDKTQIPSLPREKFTGRIFVITTPQEADRAVSYLMSQHILGFDTETRPSFRHGVNHKVAMLQVSSYDTCFLFRLNHTGITESIKTLLEDTTITKVGLSWDDDIRGLKARRPFRTGYFHELQNEVKMLGIQDGSLQKIYANLFDKMISKKQQLSNWEADILTEAQKLYAATDAWACIRIYEELHRLHSSGQFEFVPAPIEEPQPIEETEPAITANS